MANFVPESFIAYLAKTTLIKDYQYKIFNGQVYPVKNSMQVPIRIQDRRLIITLFISE